MEGNRTSTIRRVSKPIHSKAGTIRRLNLWTRGLVLSAAAFCCTPTLAQSPQPTIGPATTASTATDPAHANLDKALAAAKPYVDQLGDPDPAVRANATTMLITQGAAARPAILPIVDSPIPEVRIRARLVLSKLPWARSTDSVGVKTLLRRYGSLNAYQQDEFLGQLMNRSDKAAVETKLRLLCEETNAAIQWRVAVDIGMNPQNYDPAVLRDLPVYMSRSPILVAKSVGYREGDFQKMLDLLEQAVDMEIENPSRDAQSYYLAERSIACARYLQDPQRLARLTRKLYLASDEEQEAEGPETIGPVALLAMHAYDPRISGLDDDLWLIRQHMSDPSVLHALAEVYDARGNPFVASAIHSAAIHTWPLDVFGHIKSTYALRQAHLNRSALAEYDLICRIYRAGIANPPLGEVEPNAIYIAAVQSQVHLLSEMGRYQESLDLILQEEPFIQKIVPPGEMLDGVNRFMNQWKDRAQLNIALEKNDPTLATRQIEDVLHENEPDPEVLSVAIPLLKMLGREEQAKPLVQQAIKATREMVKESPGSPEGLNSVAWTMYLCHENLPEAQKMAEQAVKLDPINGAVRDTLANICFELGDVQRAVEMETISVRLRPGDPFIARRLATFQAALNSTPPKAQ